MTRKLFEVNSKHGVDALSLVNEIQSNTVTFNPFPSKWVLRALIDFTLSNARRFYSSMGNLLDRKGLNAITSREIPWNFVRGKTSLT